MQDESFGTPTFLLLVVAYLRSDGAFGSFLQLDACLLGDSRCAGVFIELLDIFYNRASLYALIQKEGLLENRAQAVCIRRRVAAGSELFAWFGGHKLVELGVFGELIYEGDERAAVAK